MKQSLFKWGIAPLFAGALLAPTLTLAQAVPFTSTGWFVKELVPGILCVSESGQVSFKYEVHVARNESAEPRVAGRIRGVNLDVSVKPDGTGTFSGKGCLEVGSWDPAGVVFTRTDGAWDLGYEGIIHADGSTEYRMSGRGIGGTVDGLYIIATCTRGPSPADPYLFSGKITGARQTPAAGREEL